MSRHRVLYTPVLGTNGRRHLLRGGTGTDGFPRALCEERIALRDEPAAPPCQECRLVATTEISLALDSLGLHVAAIAVARAVNELSYETPQAQSTT